MSNQLQGIEVPSSWNLIAELPIQEDLGLLSQYLWQNDIVHQLKVDADRRLLLVMNESEKELSLALIKKVLSRDVLKRSRFLGSHELAGQPETRPNQNSFVTLDQKQGLAPAVEEYFKRFPVSLGLLLLCCLGGVIVKLDGQLSIVRWLSFQDLMLQEGSLVYAGFDQALAYGQWWRLWTPSFLQLNITVFMVNVLWLLELGRRIEASKGSAYLAGLILLIAPVANLSQYLLFGPGLFGGLSGVVYGLLGYMACYSSVHSHSPFSLKIRTLVLMLLWLILLASGLLEPVLDTGEFNGMQLGGLLFGCGFGLSVACYQELKHGSLAGLANKPRP